MKKLINPVLELFPALKLTLYLVVILAGSIIYLFLVTQHLVISVVLGFVTMAFSFYHSVYLPEKLNKEQFLLKELQKYGTSMTYYLQSGYNVLHAMNLSKRKLDGQIKRDIEKTMRKLQEKAELDTSHFEKYNFNSLNIFHEILKIKYHKGGDARELFTRVNESMNFEIVKRDELYRKKRYMKHRIMVMMGMTASMPLIFVFFARDLYEQFLTMGYLAVGINASLFILLLISLFFLQRNVTDVSIYG